jgi:hypothetical protein
MVLEVTTTQGKFLLSGYAPYSLSHRLCSAAPFSVNNLPQMSRSAWPINLMDLRRVRTSHQRTRNRQVAILKQVLQLSRPVHSNFRYVRSRDFTRILTVFSKPTLLVMRKKLYRLPDSIISNRGLLFVSEF